MLSEGEIRFCKGQLKVLKPYSVEDMAGRIVVVYPKELEGHSNPQVDYWSTTLYEQILLKVVSDSSEIRRDFTHPIAQKTQDEIYVYTKSDVLDKAGINIPLGMVDAVELVARRPWKRHKFPLLAKFPEAEMIMVTYYFRSPNKQRALGYTHPIIRS